MLQQVGVWSRMLFDSRLSTCKMADVPQPELFVAVSPCSRYNEGRVLTQAVYRALTVRDMMLERGSRNE